VRGVCESNSQHEATKRYVRSLLGGEWLSRDFTFRGMHNGIPILEVSCLPSQPESTTTLSTLSDLSDNC